MIRSIAPIIDTVTVGPNTSISQVEDLDLDAVENSVVAFDSRRETGTDWFLGTDHVAFGGQVPEGADPWSRQFSALRPVKP